MSTDVTVCVLDVDGGMMLERCLESIRAQTTPPRRVIVVDNGSRIPVSDRVPANDGVEIVRLDHNSGFAAGVNEACSRSSTHLVALVNNDVTLDPRWIEQVVRAFTDEGVAAAQSVVLRPDGKVDSAGIEVLRGGFVQSLHGEAPPEPGRVVEVWGVAGTAAILRRDVVGERPFDERLFAWYEDVDLAARLRAAGWRAALITEALAIHIGSATAAAVSMGGLPLRVRNRYLVARSRRIGDIRRLLREDALRFARTVRKGEIRAAMAIAAGVVRGMSESKLAALRVRSAPQ